MKGACCRAYCIGLVGLLLALPAQATDVTLVGVFPGKGAVLQIDGGRPTTVRIGHSVQGVSVLAAEEKQALVEIDGKRLTLLLGQYASSSPAGDRERITLAADARGHFFADGSIDGGPVRFLVDTGASMVALPARDANRLGIDYRKGPRGIIQTAGGNAIAYRVTFDQVKVGGIELANVDGVVLEQGLDVALLGMTFLNRVEMQRDGQSMVLVRRY
ncbi:MAG TPA: TIGR02281 family clan AA aspartic protease [Burkholderiales bacterium]|nr:TIGR02281 family clan AA aspartic protease [Burkholderiales bacterium]